MGMGMGITFPSYLGIIISELFQDRGIFIAYDFMEGNKYCHASIVYFLITTPTWQIHNEGDVNVAVFILCHGGGHSK